MHLCLHSLLSGLFENAANTAHRLFLCFPYTLHTVHSAPSFRTDSAAILQHPDPGPVFLQSYIISSFRSFLHHQYGVPRTILIDVQLRQCYMWYFTRLDSTAAENRSVLNDLNMNGELFVTNEGCFGRSRCRSWRCRRMDTRRTARGSEV